MILLLIICLAYSAKVKSWEYKWEGTEKGRCRVTNEIKYEGDEGDKLYAFLLVID